MATDTKPPLDPRLLKRASAARKYFIQGGFLALVQVGLIVAFTWFLTQAITAAIDAKPISDVIQALAIVVLVIVARSLVGWLSDYVAKSGAAQVKTQLRSEVLSATEKIGQRNLVSDSATLVTVAGQGLDSLDSYFSKYLPQLILTVLATPILILVLFMMDLFTGIAVVVTLPLIPIFMALIGWATEKAQRKQWLGLTKLAGAFLELVEGLSTLKIFGRAERQAARLQDITDHYRKKTIRVLRISFASSFVLELAGSLSLAIVAVSIGLRLMDGDLPLSIGLFVLLLTPEAYLPMRQVGAQFHASAEGVAAMDDVFALLEQADKLPDAQLVSSAGNSTSVQQLRFSDFGVSHGDLALFENQNFVLEAGKFYVLSGPSGVGKSSFFASLLGLAQYQGRVQLNDSRLDSVPTIYSWAPQSANLFAGSVLQNIIIGAELDDEKLVTAMQLAAISPDLKTTKLQAAGSGLSGGQSQRIALARAYYRVLIGKASVLLLDEPTSALDQKIEADVITGFKTLANQGHSVLVISHRPQVAAAADKVISFSSKGISLD